MKKRLLIKTPIRYKLQRYVHYLLAAIWFMTKGITGIMIIFLTIIITAACYLICLPFLLFGDVK